MLTKYMVSQIFKLDFENEILWELLETMCQKKKDYYFINKELFKKSIMFSNNIKLFYDKIGPYYHDSKKHYIDDAFTYKKFLTVVRQICRNNNILFRSEIKYNNSTYQINYFIYYNPIL